MITHIHPEQLAQWIASAPPDAQPLVLDVREAWERQTASIAPTGAQLVSIPMGELPSRLQELDASRPTACLCHHGMRSLRVPAFLEHQGFEQVANITGGIDAWSAQVDPAVPRY